MNFRKKGYTMNRFSPLRVSLIMATALICLAGTAAAAESPDKPAYIDISDWLVLGPVKTPPPLFDQEDKEISEYLLSYPFMPADIPMPEKGSGVDFSPYGKLEWKHRSEENGRITLMEKPEEPSAAYLTAYLELDRFSSVRFRAACSYPFKLMVGEETVIESGSGKGMEEYKEGTAELKRGKHRITIKTVSVPGDSVYPWSAAAGFHIENRPGNIPVITVSPERGINIHDILDPPHIRGVELARDGKLAAVTISRVISAEGDRETETRIIRTGSGETVRTIVSEGGIGRVRWAGSGNRLSYTVTSEEGSSIRLIDLETGRDMVIARDIDELENYSWSDHGDFIIYSASREPDKNESGVKRLRGLYDRKSYGRNRSFLYLLSPGNGTRRRLTDGEHSTRLLDIHPDGGSILISRNYEQLEERPYSRTELYSIELESMEKKLLWEGFWFNSAAYSPDGDRILVGGGPSTFGSRGVNVPEGTIPNDYDGQLFIMDPEDGSVEAVTRDFKPSVLDAIWARSDGRIYITAEDRSMVGLFRHSPGSDKFEPMDTNCEVVSNVDIAPGKELALYTGESANMHRRLFRIDTNRGEGRVILDPAGSHFRNIRNSEVEKWNFTTEAGKEICGRVHYPPGFDQSENYPCIVYYYGGTSPVSRSFGGRYPKNLWAAMGYVVYVLQPSGATGFGQEFSAVHVNDWGRTTTGEIIQGTREFLKSHPFVDPGRVGCIGASFGGFMTQLLITETDIFSAAVSHAGISSISSYWGEGYWGYAYNAVSAANSFPWNNPDLYIGQSALFSANRINTPLLLLHGGSDTNVPPGESEQMYTALKLLGREVEYIKFAGQNHFILDYQKRIRWSDAIIAWFDKWLKGQDSWWNSMYPPLDKAPENIGLHNIDTGAYGRVLLGNISRHDFDEHLPSWFAEYSPDPVTASRIGDYLENIEITCVFGSWCSDSRRDIPRMWKVLEMAGYPGMEIKYLAVGSSRFTPESGIPEKLLAWSDRVKDHYEVERVATFIIYRGGREIGRIIESPEISLEKDLLKILQN
ncbi:MAG: prolyl oligopeptidase family serine peptidase [Candidatus Latescibacteria bacterium]|nr:prolyl oligopeptidase family serine peptidase [bacterium]MBD3424384.1 prolyl oligopeptidase family serine peptidase [Candidatus Latescibacterota bacterium]